MVNDIRRLAVMCDPLPLVIVSPDSDDDFLLAAAQVAEADYLATGDKTDLLALKRHGCTRIVTASKLKNIFFMQGKAEIVGERAQNLGKLFLKNRGFLTDTIYARIIDE